VVGTRADKSTEESEVRSFQIAHSGAIMIGSPDDGAILPSGVSPTFASNTNCSTKFKLEISSLIDFSDPKQIKSFSYNVLNPNNSMAIQYTLKSFQWNSAKKLITGTGYFRIRAWDGINRETISEIRSFTIGP